MGLCTDPALTRLNKLGYNVVRLPRVGLEPLDVLGRDDSFERIGRLQDLVASSNPVPEISKPMSVAEMEGKDTADLDVAIGVKVLTQVLSGMASLAGYPSIKLAYKNARSMQYRFTNVFARTIDPSQIGAFLVEARIRDNPFNDRFLLNEDTEEYVIFEVLQSDTISVVAKDEKGLNVEVDVPALQQAVGVNVKVSAGATAGSKVSFQGQEMLTFGFKCFQLAFEDGKWLVKGVKPGRIGPLVTTSLPPGPDDPIVFRPGERLFIKSPKL